MGQGSRTALPICGYFLQSVLGDSRFKHYHGKFGAPKESIDAAAYTCQGCVYSNDSDSVDIEGDSLDVDILTADPAEMGMGDGTQTSTATEPVEDEDPDQKE